jgi:hypothetical protein
MPRTIASPLHLFRVRAATRRPPYEEVWHLTDRLVWGTVLRRRDDDRWIYRECIENIDGLRVPAGTRQLGGETRP